MTQNVRLIVVNNLTLPLLEQFTDISNPSNPLNVGVTG